VNSNGVSPNFESYNGMNQKTKKTKKKINEATPQSSRDGAAQEREEW
jgi:hypothetical protein